MSRAIVGNQDPDRLLFSLFKLKRVPRNLRDRNLSHRFDELLKDSVFSRWWDSFCGRLEEKYFVLNFGADAHSIPWELLVGRLISSGRHNSVSLTRTTDEIKRPESPQTFVDSMRILILVGDDGSKSGLAKIYPDTEARNIEAAWDDLDEATKYCVEKPVVIKATRENIIDGMRRVKPHIIWFSGHAVSKPVTSLVFSGGEPISAVEFADILRGSGHSPLYAVFWACSTARPEPTSNNSAVIPNLYNALSPLGVHSILAMQSAIRDTSARIMATELFRNLAAGFSLESSLARTRAIMLDYTFDPVREDDVHEFDWAAPTIWSGGTPLDTLSWKNDKQSIARFQVAGRWITPIQLANPAALIPLASTDELAHATIWRQGPSVWLQGDVESWSDKISWLRILQAVSKTSLDVFVFPLILESTTDVELALKRYAELIYERLFPNDLPTELVDAIRLMRSTPYSGFRRLCKLPNILLGIANPPGYDRSLLFWKILLDESAPLINILSQHEITSEIQRDWQIDKMEQIEANMSNVQISEVIDHAPKLSALLAVMNKAWHWKQIISVVEKTDRIEDIQQWPGSEHIFVQTVTGPTLRASVRRHILDHLTTEQSIHAHEQCIQLFELYMNRPPSLDTIELLLDHYIGAQQIDRSLEWFNYLCQMYSNNERPYSAVRAFEKLGEWKTLVSSHLQLVVAGCYLQLGLLEQAKLRLDLTVPHSVLDQAWKHAMLSEIYKNQGVTHHRKRALDEIELAIQKCQEVLDGNVSKQMRTQLTRASLRYRQDRARIIQYLFPERWREARNEYENLILKLVKYADATLDLAAVQRNYSELIREHAEISFDERKKRARELLADAEELARPHASSPVLADVLYEKAKLAKVDNRSIEARESLIDCINVSKSIRYDFLYTIACSRYFWEHETYSDSRWNEIREELTTHVNHGFAVRVLVDGLLRHAKICELKGDLVTAQSELNASSTYLFAHPTLDQESDRSRILQTYAGLRIVDSKLAEGSAISERFAMVYPWFASWQNDVSIADLEKIWQEVPNG